MSHESWSTTHQGTIYDAGGNPLRPNTPARWDWGKRLARTLAEVSERNRIRACEGALIVTWRKGTL